MRTTPVSRVPGTWTRIINGSLNSLGIWDATSVLRRRLLPPRALDGSVVFSDCFSLVPRTGGPLWLSPTRPSRLIRLRLIRFCCFVRPLVSPSSPFSFSIYPLSHITCSRPLLVPSPISKQSSQIEPPHLLILLTPVPLPLPIPPIRSDTPVRACLPLP
jgi:hypothetical protein